MEGAGRSLEERGADAAARFLDRRGCEIVSRNLACAAGKADIVAREGEWVVFVEVATHVPTDGESPDERLGEEDREMRERVATHFLRECDAVDCPVRFDAIGINVIGSDRCFIKHLINCFNR